MATITKKTGFVGTKGNDENSSSEGDWILVEEGHLKGVTLMVHRGTGEVISLSTRSCRDADRWEQVPDLSSYPSLEVLDLHKSRYLKEFDASVCKVQNLQKLLLTGCSNLSTIAPSIGTLLNLTEVRKIDLLCQNIHAFLTTYSFL